MLKRLYSKIQIVNAYITSVETAIIITANSNQLTNVLVAAALPETASALSQKNPSA